MEKKLLWFKIPMPAGKGNPEDMLCLFCHGDPKVMGERRTKFYVHPRGTEIQQILAEKREKDEIPLVAGMQEFEGVSLFGYETIFAIRCVTCHDNHRWMAAQESKDGTSFVNTEMTSFLKGSIVAQKLCSRCHGIEALYRYRFFHQDRIFQRMVPNE
jgi:hypothetical protein